VYGTLPGIYLKDDDLKRDLLITYIDTYLKEEILAEGLIRNLEPFSRFLDICGIYSGEILNFSNISRESSVALKTVQNYFQILEDTLISFKLPAWDKSLKKQLALSSKFYFFDNSVTSVLNNRISFDLSSEEKGKLFEQWCINEVRALKFYSKSLLKLH
jgi:predicted AAA+ superfamily ATPase